MNHLTTSQIIDIGEYLEPVFDANRLTIAQLRGILQYHEISCSSKCTKKDLLKAFISGLTIELRNSLVMIEDDELSYEKVKGFLNSKVEKFKLINKINNPLISRYKTLLIRLVGLQDPPWGLLHTNLTN